MFVIILVKSGTINLNQMKHHLNGKQLVNKQSPPLFSLMHSAVRRSNFTPSPMPGQQSQSGTFYGSRVCLVPYGICSIVLPLPSDHSNVLVLYIEWRSLSDYSVVQLLICAHIMQQLLCCDILVLFHFGYSADVSQHKYLDFTCDYSDSTLIDFCDLKFVCLTLMN